MQLVEPRKVRTGKHLAGRAGNPSRPTLDYFFCSSVGVAAVTFTNTRVPFSSFTLLSLLVISDPDACASAEELNSKFFMPTTPLVLEVMFASEPAIGVATPTAEPAVFETVPAVEPAARPTPLTAPPAVLPTPPRTPPPAGEEP